MTPLLEDRSAPPEVTTGSPGDGPVAGPVCHACASAMKPGQDWCLECGTAAPGRLGARSGLRAAFAVVTVTLLLVGGAVTASYAALSNDAQRTASAPAAGSGEPIAVTPAAGADAPPVTPGETGPGVTAPANGDRAKPQDGTPIIPIEPPEPAKNTPLKIPPPSGGGIPAAPKAPAAGKSKAPSGGKSKTPSGGDAPAGGEAASAPKPEIVKFKKGAAGTYDPYERAGAEFGPAKNAIDNKKQTVWDVTVPADGKPIGAGLLLDLGKRYDLRALTIDTPTEGFNIEIYGAVSAKQTPVDILDKRWEHITDIKAGDDGRGVTDGKIIPLLKSKAKQRLLLIYITKPSEPKDPRVAIGNVTVAGTP
ncbi:MAG: hypothetical protein ACR2LK_15295 [Solirubrobacteraceae bacterium]